MFTHRLLGSFQSLPLWRQHFSCGCHLPSASSLLCTALCSQCIVWIRYRHVSASWSLCREITRTRRNDLLCNTVAAGVMNSVSTFWHGVKVDRSPEVKPVRRACAYVERRSGLLDVAYRRANLRHKPLTFWHEPLTFDVLDRHTGTELDH